MFSFIRWIKELSLDVSLDDVSACEGYPSLQAVEKLHKLRSDFAAGKSSIAPARTEPAVGGLVVALSSAPASRANLASSVPDNDTAPLRSVG
jgi:hypothetical protein